ncbi:MAG: hypothetical protein JST89_14555 [Cyanobacteria bacterium SZAS-4]|nr:hypothetical protein [Cyanobacteria bacterium SZAS-4]
MSTSRFLLGLLALGAIQNTASAPVAFAEETLRADVPRLDTRPVQKRAPLSGSVSVQANHKLPAPVVARKPAPIAQPKTVVSVAPQRAPLTASANSFGGVPMQGALDRNPYMRGYTGFNPYAMRAQQMHQMMQQQAQKKWTNPDDAPYRWGQCGTGGYYDTTGTYKGPMVWGDKLASYGGRFFDGTPVPKGEVKVNQMGHIWWQNQLSTNFVKQEELRKKGLPY